MVLGTFVTSENKKRKNGSGYRPMAEQRVWTTLTRVAKPPIRSQNHNRIPFGTLVHADFDHPWTVRTVCWQFFQPNAERKQATLVR